MTVVNLPSRLFLNPQIPVSLWFIRKNKTTRKGQILFIDSREMGKLINRRQRTLTQEDIKKLQTHITNGKGKMEMSEDIKGFCKSVTI